jgi:hypothetical protein
MHGFPNGLDLSFFVGKRLDQVSFAEYTIFVRFEGGVSVELASSFQHQTKRDVEQQRVGIVQSVPVTHSSLMQAVGRSVASASGDDEGALTLVFDDGQVVRFVEERIPYESYTFKDGDREYIV